MIKLRKFSESDLRAVRKIERASFPGRKPRPLEKYVREHPEECIVAENENKVVGYIVGRVKQNSIGVIAFLAVEPSSRGKGIGEKLIRHLANGFEKKNIKETLLYVRARNDTAIALYQKLGFAISKKIEKYYRDGDDALVMEKG